MKAIEMFRLSKKYGDSVALRDVTVEVEAGEAVALVGPNGAGKTTLLRILATLLKPSSGFARVLGMDGRYEASRIRRRIGYMPDAVVTYDDLTVREYLDFFAGVHGLGPAEREARVRDLVKLLDLGAVADRPSSALSRGMQQRLGLARTLIHDPDILLLDEPAANLDPRSRIEMREVLKELRKMGKTMIVSSHILVELGELCNTLLLLDVGGVVYSGTVAEAAARLGPAKRLAIRVEGRDPDKFRTGLMTEPDVEEVTAAADGWIRITLKPGVSDFSFVVRRAVQEGFSVLGLREEEVGLESIFMNLTGEKRTS